MFTLKGPPRLYAEVLQFIELGNVQATVNLDSQHVTVNCGSLTAAVYMRMALDDLTP